MTVHLVGAGPGDPDLLTMRAISLLTQADVVVHDRLVDHRILASVAPWAEVIDVGKTPGSTRNTQNEINEILIDRGKRFDTVVRLKGGDPFVFGRGGEEALALTAAGIDVAIVPGISSAIAAPAAAGVPVTHRGLARGVSIVTAHQDGDGGLPLDWAALAQSGTTLVVLMGAARAREVSQRLRDGGMAADTPVAVVTAATRDNQTTRRLPLSDLGRSPVEAPAVIVVGAVADLDVTASISQLALAQGDPE